MADQTPTTEEQIPNKIEDQLIIDDTEATEPEQVIEEEISDEELIKEEDIEDTREEIKYEELSNKKEVTRKDQKVLQDFPINSSEKLETGDELVFPSNFDVETRKVLEETPNINLIDNPAAREWAKDIAEGLELNTFNETYVSTLEDENAEFKHKLEQNGTSLSAQSPKFKNIENQNLKGERAVIRFISHLGLGTLFQVPLWHSGIWVTFKPPSESEIIELNRMLINDKIKLGRYTYGLSFSNVSSYTTDRLVDFALAHVYDLTSKAEDINIDNLKGFISCQDIPSLLWGFICTMYPRGFKYRRACVNDPEKCNFVLEDTLNISKLQWTNTNALTEWQKTFMAGRQSKIKDLTSINRYKEELTRLQKKKIIINEGRSNEVSIIIKTPTITEHIESGHRWITEIVDIVEKTVGLDANEADRNNFVVRHGQASAMRQYGHWVDSIEYDTNIINDRETIEATLDIISSDDEVRTEFIKGVVDYINSSTISVIGIPVFDCPSCKKSQESIIELPQFVNIIPLDVIQLFFGLLTQRLNRLTSR